MDTAIIDDDVFSPDLAIVRCIKTQRIFTSCVRRLPQMLCSNGFSPMYGHETNQNASSQAVSKPKMIKSQIFKTKVSPSSDSDKKKTRHSDIPQKFSQFLGTTWDRRQGAWTPRCWAAAPAIASLVPVERAAPRGRGSTPPPPWDPRGRRSVAGG